MKLRRLISAAAACAVAASAFAMTTASAEDSYVVGLTWQSSSYMFRNTISQPNLLYWDNDLGEAAELEGATFTDATVTGDGTYTVTLDGVSDGGWNMLKLESNIDLDELPDVKFEITDITLNGESVDFDETVTVMSEDAATKSDEYSEWEFDIKNTARVQIINVYDNISAIPNDKYESISVTFNVTGLSAAAEDTTAADDTAAATDTATATGEDKGSPDTGVEGIAVVAGVAAVAAGAVVMSRKRK